MPTTTERLKAGICIVLQIGAALVGFIVVSIVLISAVAPRGFLGALQRTVFDGYGKFDDPEGAEQVKAAADHESICNWVGRCLGVATWDEMPAKIREPFAL